ncbi:HET-domain-containing protein [Hypoxylon fuscum]|nr:HET-domain-containing protein [Hypoxylon fuscum]
MHLLDVNTLQLEKFVKEKDGKAVVNYGILSHRWLAQREKVTFQDIETGNYHQKTGCYKLLNCCEQAKRDNLRYVWIDTCCIDKTSNTELQEAINSMYRWYENADKCYAFLKDTVREESGDLRLCQAEEWFQRGWTLQELIAPKEVHFFDCRWQYIGDRVSLKHLISDTTGIGLPLLEGTRKPHEFSVAERMSWASGRKTTRDEDRSYSLIGLFDVNMPMLYGEGATKAFLRLQEEIIKTSDDHSIFAWKGVQGAQGLLATSPDSFRDCKGMRGITRRSGNIVFSMTNRGLSITLNLRPWAVDTYLALIDCEEARQNGDGSTSQQLGIFLRRLEADDQYARVGLDGKDIYRNVFKLSPRYSRDLPIYVRQVRIDTEKHANHERLNGFRVSSDIAKSAQKGQKNWNAQERIVYFTPNMIELQEKAVLWIKKHGNQSKIELYFDFNFNPILHNNFKDVNTINGNGDRIKGIKGYTDGKEKVRVILSKVEIGNTLVWDLNIKEYTKEKEGTFLKRLLR